MKRWSIVITGFGLFSLLLSAQQPAPSHNRVLSSDLVLWSYMQQPQPPEQNATQQQPKPETTPDTQPSVNPTPVPPTSPEQESPQPNSATATDRAPTAQTLTGTISKESDNFVLKVSPTATYKLDDQQRAQQYEGRRVRVTGTVESEINLIHVGRIEPLS